MIHNREYVPGGRVGPTAAERIGERPIVRPEWTRSCIRTVREGRADARDTASCARRRKTFRIVSNPVG
jgi:hypothetical protein